MREPYFTFNRYLKDKFGPAAIKKIPLFAGFSCPNRDGTLAHDGCIYCDAYGAGPIKSSQRPIASQIETYLGIYPEHKFIAYFQAFSNTYGPLDKLRSVYAIPLQYPEIIAIAIGTRPDTVSREVSVVLSEINRQRPILIELGLQSIHDTSLQLLQRHHTYQQFLDAYAHLANAGIAVVVHLIVGIPGESKADMLATIHEINRLKPAGIKLHPLHVLRGTQLEAMFRRGEVPLLEEEPYLELIGELLEHLDPQIVIHRLTGERERELFVAPAWCLDKARTLAKLHSRMQAMGAYQGRLFSH